MPGLDDLYREIILDHHRNPRNRGTLETPPARVAVGHNPLCGDEIDDIDPNVMSYLWTRLRRSLWPDQYRLSFVLPPSATHSRSSSRWKPRAGRARTAPHC